MSTRWTLGDYAKGLVGNRVVRIAVLVVVLVFIGGFWVLDNLRIIEPSQTVAVIGVALFVVVALPVALVAARASDRALDRDV
ncbi:hypothetical protein ACHABX_05510 [Nesterenkonia halotolerans]|uniref:hypothetical protein n=1 Tax=Nesterenkonia halotolerans TaxID=225325 RepID=UPI003EE7E13D